MKLVSLMAGSCLRLLPLTRDRHKVLLEIGGKSLVEHQLEAFKEVGIEEAIFVVGHKAELIQSKLGDHYNGIEIKYIPNPHYSTHNIDYSLYLAKEEVKGEDFIYFEADMFFHPKILKNIMDSCFENCLAVDSNPQSDMVDTLVLGVNNQVKGLIFKDHGDIKNILKEPNVVGEFISIMKFNGKASLFLFNELEKSKFEGPITLNRVFERCFQIFPMHYIEAKGYPWVEIDNYNDLRKARRLRSEGLF